MSSDNEEDQYENWKRNIPFMYDISIIHQLEWPSLTVQWLGEVEIDQNNNEVHRLLISTHTENAEQNYLHCCKVALPQTMDQEIDFTLLNNIWNTQNVGKVSIEMSIPVPAEINRIRYMPQNFRIAATQTSNGQISVFNLQTRSLDANMVGQKAEGYGLSWNGVNEGQLLSASYDNSVYLWDIEKQQNIRSYCYHEKEVEDVNWKPMDPNIFLSASSDCTFALYLTPLSKGAVLRLKAHKQEVFCIQFNPFYDQLFATGSADSDAKLFDVNKLEKELHCFEYHQEAIYQLQWSPNQHNLLATGSQDSKVVVWDQLRIGNEIKAEDEKDGPAELLFYHGGHRSKVTDISWNTKNNPLMASVEEGQTCLQIWRIQKQLLEEDENDELLASLF